MLSTRTAAQATMRAFCRCAALLVTTTSCASWTHRSPERSVAVFERSFTAQEVEMLSAVLEEISRQQRPLTVGCLTLLGPTPERFAPSDEFLRRLSPKRVLVREAECPPTYTKLTQRVDSLGRSLEPLRPAGYIDPYHIDLGRPQFDGKDRAYIDARDSQGTRGRTFSCEAGGLGARVVRCTVVRQWTS